jgi:hypothetical protein
MSQSAGPRAVAPLSLSSARVGVGLPRYGAGRDRERDPGSAASRPDDGQRQHRAGVVRAGSKATSSGSQR